MGGEGLKVKERRGRGRDERRGDCRRRGKEEAVERKRIVDRRG